MFRRIYFFFFTYLSAVSYGQTLLFLWFQKNGVSIPMMLFYFFIQCSFGLGIYFLVEGRSLTSRTSILFGVASSALGVFFSSIITYSWQFLLVAVCFSVTNVFFWTIYNVLYFKYMKEEEHGYKSGLYFLLFPISGAIFAPLAGYVAEKFGYKFMFDSALLLYIIPFILVFYLPSFIIKFESKYAIKNIENKVLIFFQGCSSIFGFALIPILTLFFITTPMKLGNFFGYLAILSALTAVVNSKISDKLRKRASFFYFFTILNSFSYLLIVFSRSLFGLQIFTGINNVTNNLANPFSIALVLDYAKMDTMQTMLGRELYLNAGRATLMLLLIIVFWFTRSFAALLIIASLVSLLYPILAYYKKVYIIK